MDFEHFEDEEEDEKEEEDVEGERDTKKRERIVSRGCEGSNR